MNIKEAVDILEQHNVWRRGGDIPQQDVVLIGEAIDLVVDYVKSVMLIRDVLK